MNRATQEARRGRAPLARIATLLAVALALAATPIGAPVSAKDFTPFAARQGVDLARAAAVSWSADAVLVYVENDEPIDGQGSASRWGYLFFSPALEKSRAYSVRDGKIVTA